MQVHNRYRSVIPSGENRVVDVEAEALRAAGHEVISFERESDEIEHWSKAKKASLPVRLLWSREAHRDITTMLAQRRPDVVHVHNTFPLITPSILYACRDAGVPVVFTLHNKRLVCATGDFFRDGSVCHDCTQGNPLPGVIHGCYRGSHMATASVAVATTIHRQAWKTLISAYVFISASQRDLLSELGFDQERVFVRHHLIPRRVAPPAVSREPMVLFVGRMHAHKGVRVLMAAWDSYLSRPSTTPGLRLVISGAGPLEDEVADWASTRPSVDFAGRVDDATLNRLLSTARAVLIPSTGEETFGLVSVEAMAMGVPPVAAARGAFVELITPGVDGDLFPPDDAEAMAQAIADIDLEPQRYEDYGVQARKTYEQRFDPDRSLEELVDIYRYAIDHPVHRSAERVS
jgi:glycosyltransferase involved in cell wall biosynthesis